MESSSFLLLILGLYAVGKSSSLPYPNSNGHSTNGLMDITQEQKTYLVRFLTALETPRGTKVCEAPEHCDITQQRCDDTAKLCVSKDSPEMPLLLPNGKLTGNSAWLVDTLNESKRYGSWLHRLEPVHNFTNRPASHLSKHEPTRQLFTWIRAKPSAKRQLEGWFHQCYKCWTSFSFFPRTVLCVLFLVSHLKIW